MSEVGLKTAEALALKALSNGGELISFGQLRWDVSADCEKSAGVSLHGTHFRGTRNYPEGGFTAFQGAVRRDPRPRSIHLQVRCGKCAKCRRLRRRVWTARALAEVQRSVRTWLCTLTATPEQHYAYVCAASRRGETAGFDYDALSEAEKYAEQCKAMGADLTKYVKRLRKESGARVRAMWVFEPHKSGSPHIHGLLHEVEGSISWRVLDRQWIAGHSRFNLLTSPRGAAYAAKYLSKESGVRIRASRFYGQEKQPPVGIGAECAPCGRFFEPRVKFVDVREASA